MSGRKAFLDYGTGQDETMIMMLMLMIMMLHAGIA